VDEEFEALIAARAAAMTAVDKHIGQLWTLRKVDIEWTEKYGRLRSAYEAADKALMDYVRPRMQ
jgi:hypothetical protein